MWELILGVSSLTVSMTAIVISVYQICLSNKHQLFERRSKSYLFISDFVSLCKSNDVFLIMKCDDQPILSLETEFIFLTNNGFLESIGPLIFNPLEDKELHRKFLFKMEEIENKAMEITFLFPHKLSAPLSRLVLAYKKLLIEMRAYQIRMNKISSDEQPITIREMDFEHRMEFFKEKEFRKPLIEAYEELRASYEYIEENHIMDKAAKTMKLVR